MMIQLNNSRPFNLDFTLGCGQAFRWNKRGEWWYGVVRERVFKIRHVSDRLEFENAETDFVDKYFGLRDNLSKILPQISKDKHAKAAVGKFKGLRILRQDPWECLVSYICATYKNIPAIKKMLFNLSKRFGDKSVFDSLELYTFPAPAKLAKANIKELVECGLGYRAKYISETAKTIHKKDCEPEKLRKTSYKRARQELLNLPGVGLKVADCVLLFSLGKLEAFPIDVWIKRIITKYYASHFAPEFIRKIEFKNSPTSLEYEKLNLFGRMYFGKYAGYAQEYLYHFERTRC